jgi:hypothetical protein
MTVKWKGNAGSIPEITALRQSRRAADILLAPPPLLFLSARCRRSSDQL